MKRKLTIDMAKQAPAICLGLVLSCLLLLAVPVRAQAQEAPLSDDVYQELEQILEEEKAASYEGYILQINKTVSSETETAIQEGLSQGTLSEIAYACGSYRVHSLRYVKAHIPEEDIDYIEPDFEAYTADATGVSGLTDDFYSSEQYYLDHINLPQVWGHGLEGQDVDASVDMDGNGSGDDDDIVVAVIDSGLKRGHEDIDWKRVIDGVNFSGSEAADTDDRAGHGTAVTGIIAAKKNNGKGIAGMLQHVKVLPIRAFYSDRVNTAVIITSVNYAAEQKELYDSTGGREGTNISVINLSLRSGGPSEALETACKRAIDAGILVVCAAGNLGDTTSTYPAQYAMGVGAATKTKEISAMSQRLSTDNGSDYANKVWVSAPGEDIQTLSHISTNTYIRSGGTSFSCAQVSALAALCKSVKNDITQAQFMALLKDTAACQTGRSGDIDGQDVEFGWGMVDCKATVERLLTEQFGALPEEPFAPPPAAEDAEEPDTQEEPDRPSVTPVNGGQQAAARPAPGKVQGLSCRGNPTDKSIKVTFSKVRSATDYQLAWRVRGAGNWHYLNTGNKNSCTITKLRKAELYDIRVRAFRRGDRQFGAWSSTDHHYLKSLKIRCKTGSKKVRIKWSKDKSAAGYKIYCATNKKMKNAKVITVRGAGRKSRRISGLKKGRVYYFAVRPYKQANGLVYAGEAKTICIKIK